MPYEKVGEKRPWEDVGSRHRRGRGELHGRGREALLKVEKKHDGRGGEQPWERPWEGKEEQREKGNEEENLRGREKSPDPHLLL